MKIYLSMVILLFGTNFLQAQPVGKQLSIELNMFFFQKKITDTISFVKNNNSEFIAKKYKVSFYSQQHKYNNGLFEKQTEILLDNVDLIRSKVFKLWYYTSIENIDNKLIPTEDIILTVKKNNREMKIYIKLYNVKKVPDLGSSFFLPIKFKEGIFKITDLYNPKLLVMKEDE